MSDAGVGVIVNPAAGRGTGARRLREVREAFAAVGVRDLLVTTTPGEEAALARRALGSGATTLVAVGGDGTWSNVAGAILASGADCRLALVAAGTGNDFAKTIGAPAMDVAATARLAREGPDVRVDVGRIEDRTFLNIAGFGIDIAVLEDIHRIHLLSGTVLYVTAALRQLAAYGGVEIEVGMDGASPGPQRHLMLIVANARRFGGAFHVAPGASLVDGRLDAVSIHDATPWRRLGLFRALVEGTHLGYPEVTVRRSPSFRLRFPSPPAYETDGEYRRAATSELEITCMPRALRVVTAASGGAIA
ncbi:MAG TPA: YegS/Rv2252/BmrU family lipid kinase [Terriglobales bacterium]|nr:YegS/Rv2252/BmrU family lipid kinase [Terriglobales bacterium]